MYIYTKIYLIRKVTNNKIYQQKQNCNVHDFINLGVLLGIGSFTCTVWMNRFTMRNCLKIEEFMHKSE